MSTNKFLAAALATSSLLVTGVAGAAVLVTMDPTAQNGLGVNGVVSAGNPAFQAVGLQSNLYSVLTIAGNAGVQGFSETGHIDVNQFFDSSNNAVASGVFSNYKIIGDFTVTGFGAWVSPNLYNASAAGLALNVSLHAISATNQIVQLGTASLAPGLAVAFATTAGTVNPGDVGQGLTSLSATLNFTPAAGTTGLGGFWQAPIPFNIGLAVGNAGGNTFNTQYTVDAAGAVTFTTPFGNNNPGTANVTFIDHQVPEPGMLSLAGLALVGLAAVGRRNKARATA